MYVNPACCHGLMSRTLETVVHLHQVLGPTPTRASEKRGNTKCSTRTLAEVGAQDRVGRCGLYTAIVGWWSEEVSNDTDLDLWHCFRELSTPCARAACSVERETHGKANLEPHVPSPTPTWLTVETAI